MADAKVRVVIEGVEAALGQIGTVRAAMEAARVDFNGLGGFLSPNSSGLSYLADGGGGVLGHTSFSPSDGGKHFAEGGTPVGHGAPSGSVGFGKDLIGGVPVHHGAPAGFARSQPSHVMEVPPDPVWAPKMTFYRLNPFLSDTDLADLGYPGHTDDASWEPQTHEDNARGDGGTDIDPGKKRRAARRGGTLDSAELAARQEREDEIDVDRRIRKNQSYSKLVTKLNRDAVKIGHSFGLGGGDYASLVQSVLSSEGDELGQFQAQKNDLLHGTNTTGTNPKHKVFDVNSPEVLSLTGQEADEKVKIAQTQRSLAVPPMSGKMPSCLEIYNSGSGF